MESKPTLEDLLLKWEEYFEAGQNIPAEELCADAPELATELNREIERLQLANEMLGVATEISPLKATLDTVNQEELSTVSSYRDLEYFNSGGRGEIYRAEHSELRRGVAIKFLKSSTFDDNEGRSRFLFEVEATSQLDHPGIAPVYSSGTAEDGRLFYAMRFIRGTTLEEKIDRYHKTHWTSKDESRRRQAFNQLLRYLVSASKTIAYAHKRSILNLDIKPRNVMLGKYGETIVVDWGEATPLDQENFAHLQTEGPLPVAQENTYLDGSTSDAGGGTLPYMAPERMPKTQGPIGPATDIYSLGITLFRILTGIEAFRATHRSELLEKIENGDRPKPSAVHSSVPKPLEAICEKAIAHKPSDRYETALEFANEIQRWLDGEPVQVYRESGLERLSRWFRHHQTWAKTLAASLIAVVLIMTAMSLILGRAWDSAEHARQDADVARKQNLQLGAESTARLVGRAFETRWRILESAAAESALLSDIEAVQQSDEIVLNQGPQLKLQQRLLAIHDKWKSVTHASSMLVLDQQGIILARVPIESNTKGIVGKSFRFRDYFHGLDKDFDKDEVESNPPDPIFQRHVSVAFRSRDNQTLRVQFTVPIVKDSVTVGVIGMAVNIKHFDELRGKDIDLPLILADLRGAEIDDRQFDTLILHHPGMSKSPKLQSLDDPKLVKQLHKLVAIHKYEEQQQHVSESWFPNYTDQIVGGQWRLAIEPIRVELRHGEDRQPLKMVVIAQERIQK